MSEGKTGILEGILQELGVRQDPLWGASYLAVGARVNTALAQRRTYYLLAGGLLAVAVISAVAGWLLDQPVIVGLAVILSGFLIASTAAAAFCWQRLWRQWQVLSGLPDQPTVVILLHRRQKRKGSRAQFLTAVKVRGGGWFVSPWYSERKKVASYLDCIFAGKDCLVVFTAELAIPNLRMWGADQVRLAQMACEHLFERLEPLPPR